MAQCAALILAGGSGNRLGSDIPKQYRPEWCFDPAPHGRYLPRPPRHRCGSGRNRRQDRELYNVAIGDADVPLSHRRCVARGQAELAWKP